MRATRRSSFSEFITKVTPLVGSGSLPLKPNAFLIFVIIVKWFVSLKVDKIVSNKLLLILFLNKKLLVRVTLWSDDSWFFRWL